MEERPCESLEVVMPEYLYKCPNCSHRREMHSLIAERHFKQCPDCFTVMRLLPSVPASFEVGKYGKGRA